MHEDNSGALPADYHGREQAYVKHTILRTYLQRLFMIIGLQPGIDTINYVDCFAGPWEDETEDLQASSIGISLAIIRDCQERLLKAFGRRVKFRALYIEKGKSAFPRLRRFIDAQSGGPIELKAQKADYTTVIPEILDWCGPAFTFFFIDPKGWRQIGPETLRPLLLHPRSEFLINMMYEFANRAATMKHQGGQSFIETFGEIPGLADLPPDEREATISAHYRRSISAIYGGRHSLVKVERPGHERTLYFLVYLTRHSRGIAVFREEAEKMEMVQVQAHTEARLRRQLASDQTDLFGELPTDDKAAQEALDNTALAKQHLLAKLSSGPLLIDHDCWADMLEEANCYPKDFQRAMKELLNEQRVVNLTEDITTRKKVFIKPNWSQKAETWRLA